MLVWSGFCDHVWLCHYLAAGLEKDAADGRICKQTGYSDLGHYLGKTDLWGKDNMEYAGRGRSNILWDLSGDQPEIGE